MMALKRLRGFVLPLAVLLVIILTISGTAFMHHDYLERRMASNNVDNQGAFYLANAGIERSKEAFKIPQPAQSWTSVLQDPAQTDATYPADLCPCGAPCGCVIPPFGATVTASDVPLPMPFEGTFVSDPNAHYTVRAFNNEASTIDLDRIIVFRARGGVRSERKLLELTALATTTAGWANCQGTVGDDCPDSVHPNADIDHMPGRDGQTFDTLPTIDYTFYSTQTNFPWTTATHACGSGIDCSGSTITIDAANGGFYVVQGLSDPANTLVEVDANGNKEDIVVFSEARIEVKSHSRFTENTILVSLGNVDVKGNVDLVAPGVPTPSNPTPSVSTMYPAIISGGSVGADNGVDIWGNIYATGVIDLLPSSIHGILVGTDIHLQSAGTDVTDGGNIAFYGLMPGITYPPEWIGSTGVTNGWRELQ